MPPPPSGGRGAPGPPSLLPVPPKPAASSKHAAPSSTSTTHLQQPSHHHSITGTTTISPAGSAAATIPRKSESHTLATTAESLSNIEPEKKIAVLKKAILSLTKQKQDLEATKTSLETKITTLASQLAASDEKNSRLEQQNQELQHQVESFAATTRGAGRFTARAGSILKVFSGGDASPAAGGSLSPSMASPTSEDQQRLFEDNEALHIQLFEQRQQFEKKYKLLESEKSELAMQLHALEGLVASFQASDVAQSQQAEEAFKELQTEKAYNIRCMEIIRSDFIRDNVVTSSGPTSIPSTAEDHSQITADDSATSSSSAHLRRVVSIYTEGLSDVLAGVSAFLPHVPSNHAVFGVQSQSLEGERKKGLFTKQQKERLQAVVVAHRNHRQRIQTEITKVKSCFPDYDIDGPSAAAHGVNDDDLNSNLIDLFGQVKEWLLFIHCNASLILGPLDSLRLAREKRARRMGSATSAALVPLASLLQQVISMYIGEMGVIRDFIDAASSTSGRSSAQSTNKGGKNLAAPTTTLSHSSMVALLMCYRDVPSSSSKVTAASGMLFERFVYDVSRVLEVAAEGDTNTGAGSEEVLSRHYLTCMEQLLHSIGRSRKSLMSALGMGVHGAAIAARVAPSTTSDNDRPNALLRRMLNPTRSNVVGADGQHIGTVEDIWELVKSSDSNTRHHVANFQHAMTELARMHDVVDNLTQQSGALLKDKEHMKAEYVSVVQIYESQIAMLSERLAELTNPS